MSLEGAQNRGKDGGAHENAHETSFDEGILYLTKDTLTSDVRDITDVHSLQLVQDGDSTVSIRGLLAGDGEDLDSYSYDQTVVDVSAEWMKSRCKNLGIEFDIVGEENVGDILGLDPESNSQFLSGGISEDNGMLCSDGGNLEAHSISSSNDAKCSDIMPLCSLPDDLNLKTEQVLSQSIDAQTGTSGLVIGSFGTGGTSVFGDLPSSLHSHSVGFQPSSVKTEQNFDDPSDIGTLTQSHSQIQNILDSSYASINPSSSQSILGSAGTISTCVSDSGGILPNFLGINRSLSTPSVSELGMSDGDNGPNAAIESLQQNVFLSAADGVTTSVTSNPAPVDTDPSRVGINDPGNVTLATISVSTDKEANSTQILVNTSQGQQLYMINTADLNQATSAIMPLAQPVDSLSSVQTLTTVPQSGVYVCILSKQGFIQ